MSRKSPFLQLIAAPEIPSSPRVEALKQAAAAGDRHALPDFWAQIAVEGTPLVEPIDGDPDYRLVTFLWRADQAIPRKVLVLIDTVTDREREDLEPHLMEHIPDTDVWYKTYRLRSDHRARYYFYPDDGLRPTLKPDAGATRPGWIEVLNHAVPDPLNPQRFPPTRLQPETSVLALDAAPPWLWQHTLRGVPAGEVSEHTVSSAILGNERPVWVYTPPDYSPDKTYGLLVLLDGDVWGAVLPVAPTLDALIAAGQIPPLIALMPSAIDMDTRWIEMAGNADFVRFLADELLPWAQARWSFSDQPAQHILTGQSLGGLTAAYAGFLAPAQFGSILALSGSFWWRSDSEFDVEAEWLSQQFAITPRKPLRFYLASGLQEEMILIPNRHLRDVLRAKGYDLHYVEYNGGHDYLCWCGGIAAGLIALTAPWDEQG